MTPKPSLSDGIPLNEPQTDAGRELLRYGEDGTGNTLREDILAIEREARGIPLIPDLRACGECGHPIRLVHRFPDGETPAGFVSHSAIERESLREALVNLIERVQDYVDDPRSMTPIYRATEAARAALTAPPASGGIPLIDVEPDEAAAMRWLAANDLYAVTHIHESKDCAECRAGLPVEEGERP